MALKKTLAKEKIQEKPEKNKRKIIIYIPYCCKNILKFLNLSDIKLKSIHEPSSGGMGTKLNIPRIKLYIAIIPKKFASWDDIGKNLIAKQKIIAIKKFTAGPAMETFSPPHFWSLKL